MKKQAKKQLALSKEIVRSLKTAEMNGVGGAGTTKYSTVPDCTTGTGNLLCGTMMPGCSGVTQ
jgi:hypothetical protein